MCGPTALSKKTMLIIWTTGLLFSMTSLGDGCVLGMVGESAILPCVYNETHNLDGGNISVEWRTGSELVHRLVLGEAGEVMQFPVLPGNRTRLMADVVENGDVSLLISDVTVGDERSYDCFLSLPGAQSSMHLCSLCLSAAAHFSHPVVQRSREAEGEEAHFICHSRGGFPKPAVHWFIDNREHPLVDTVYTYSTLLPDSELYNITSILSVNVTHDITVSCAIENRLLNETLTSTFEVPARPAVGRASDAMWMFSTALCVIVGLLVLSAVVYQVKQDCDSKKKSRSQHREIKGSSEGETAEIMTEHLNSLTETTV